jgi:hypothetical protein
LGALPARGLAESLRMLGHGLSVAVCGDGCRPSRPGKGAGEAAGVPVNALDEYGLML